MELKNFDFTGIFKNKKFILIILLLSVAVILLICSDGSKNKEVPLENSKNYFDAMEYISSIENKIKNMTEQVTGSVATVSVGIKSSGEYVYAFDESKSDSSEKSECVIIRDNENNNSPIYIGYSLPEISGIAIVCEGGEKTEIKLRITNMISTAFGISSNKIFVCGAK